MSGHHARHLLHSGYINFTSVYLVWLVGAVFYHLPSLDSMGLNIKASGSFSAGPGVFAAFDFTDDGLGRPD